MNGTAMLRRNFFIFATFKKYFSNLQVGEYNT